MVAVVFVFVAVVVVVVAVDDDDVAVVATVDDIGCVEDGVEDENDNDCGLVKIGKDTDVNVGIGIGIGVVTTGEDKFDLCCWCCCCNNILSIWVCNSFCFLYDFSSLSSKIEFLFFSLCNFSSKNIHLSLNLCVSNPLSFFDFEAFSISFFSSFK